LDPLLELRLIEAQEVTPLHERDAPLCHEPPDVPLVNAEALSDRRQRHERSGRSAAVRRRHRVTSQIDG